MKENEREWLKGHATLGAATKWTAEEIRLVTELGYGLAEQGRIAEAITLFEGLAALAPATVYFQSALGALWLRVDASEKALDYLNQVLQVEPRDLISLVNRGEVFLRLGEKAAASRDFQSAINLGKKKGNSTVEEKSLTRARALLASIEKQFI
ncbi:MAG: type III secretion protein [Pyrinomonadaceae bacterium]